MIQMKNYRIDFYFYFFFNIFFYLYWFFLSIFLLFLKWKNGIFRKLFILLKDSSVFIFCIFSSQSYFNFLFQINLIRNEVLYFFIYIRSFWSDFVEFHFLLFYFLSLRIEIKWPTDLSTRIFSFFRLAYFLVKIKQTLNKYSDWLNK